MLSRTTRPDATTRRPAPGLTTGERRELLAWVEAARPYGLDAAEDLGMRPWPEPMTAEIVGIFRTGEELATWLVVGQRGMWSAIDVESGNVLATEPSLGAALFHICPVKP